MDDRLEVVLPRLSQEFKRLPVPVRKLLQLCDGTRTIEKLSQTKLLSPDETLKVVARLEKLGVVARRSKEEKRKRQLSAQAIDWMRKKPGKEFTADEDEFFEKTIDHLLEPTDLPNEEA